MSYPADDIDLIEQHLRGLDALDAFPPNLAMVQRLKDGMTEAQDRCFHQHEMVEAGLMAIGMSSRAAHLRTLAQQQIIYEPGYEAKLYHPTVILRYPDYFNPAVLKVLMR